MYILSKQQYSFPLTHELYSGLYMQCSLLPMHGCSFPVLPRCVAGIPLAVELVLINPALFAVLTTLSCLGILFACACIVFNLVFREKK